jgi:hypothetical protein
MHTVNISRQQTADSRQPACHGYHLKSNFNLRNTTRQECNVGQIKLAKPIVITRHRTFTFEDLPMPQYALALRVVLWRCVVLE